MNFCAFGKTTPYGKNFQNSVPKVFIATPINVLCSNFEKFGRREISNVVRYLPAKTISPGCLALASARIAPKICQGSPREGSHSAPDFIQIGSLSAELYPNA